LKTSAGCLIQDFSQFTSGILDISDLMVLDFASLILLSVGLIGTGAIAGLLAGLLGVGGGIVIVPVLYNIFTFLEIQEGLRMHLAVGTSLATIIPTAISSARAHHKRGAIDRTLLVRWSPWICTGAIIGTVVANQLSGRGLALLFAVIALLVSIDIIRQDNFADSNTRISEETALPSTLIQRIIASLVGSFSAMIGIGGGTLTVPVLNAWRYPIHKAIGTSAVFGLLISLPATIGYLLGGSETPAKLPLTVGYVNLLSVFLISVATIYTAPLGTRIAHASKPRILRLLFALFLAVTALRILVQM